MSDTVSFADVAADAYYADAVAWAAANGVTAGTSASFQFISAMHTSANTIIATARRMQWALVFVQTACRLRITPEALLRAAARV